jgi:hypothetical protein
MLNFLRVLKRSFRCLFSKKESQIIESKVNKGYNNMALHIILLNDTDVGINLVKPNLIDVDNKIIIDLAEQYASFLLYTTTKMFKEKTINNVKKEYQNSLNFNDKLFYDNVLAFYNVLENELDRLSSNSKPLIRPTSVFNTQNH